MKWLDRLERKFGRFAIRDLMKYIVILNGIVYLLMISRQGAAVGKLALIPPLVMAGEVWRLITYIFIPPAASPIFIFFVLYFYYMIGSALEQTWGSFRFNLYYLLGMVGTTAAAFITGGFATATYLNLSLFLAFARLYPNFEILLFFILPVKVKYLAWLNWAFIAYTVLVSPLPNKIFAIVSILNYLLFFGRATVRSANNRRRAHSYRKQTQRPKTVHKCTICGITEEDDPDMEFRYCSKCEGDYEYCMNHLRNHEHLKND